MNYVISPHLDDAVFSLGGMIKKEYKKTYVITVFSGIPEKRVVRLWDIACGFKDSTEAVNSRMKENENALVGLGISTNRIINLSFLDEQYRKSLFGKSKFSDIDKQNLVTELRKIIESQNKEHINIFIPMMDYHKDHKIVIDICLSLAKVLDKSKYTFFTYLDMPYFYTYLKKEEKKNKEKSVVNILQSIYPKNGTYERNVIELSEEEFADKITAAKMYKSQFRSKLFGYNSLPKHQEYLSTKQAEAFSVKSKHCEVVYKLITID